jgi:superfamily II DNA or RNA helicase
VAVDLTIERINNVHARVTTDDLGILQELSDFFTYMKPGYQWSKAYKMRHWDGKTRLFNAKNGQIYHGLARYVEEYAKRKGYTYESDSEEFYPVDISNFTKAINLTVEPRDYQAYAASHALSRRRAVIESPTGSGKSLIIYLIARHLLQNKKQGLLVVPTISLVEQMYKDFKEYGWNVEDHCQKIYGGQGKEPTAPLVISTWQSIYDLPKRYFKQFDFIIGDEAHTFKADSLVDLMSKLVNCDVRIGLTGTVNSEELNKLVLEGLFGPVKKIISTKQLIDRKQLSPIDIKGIILEYEEELCKMVSKTSYQEELDFLVGYEPRNKFIRNLGLSLKGNTLILFTYVDKHGKILYDMIQKKAEFGRKVFFVHGDTDVDDREEIRRITESENDAIIVASFGTFSTGINIKRLHNIVFASPTKSKIRSLQSVGRGLRLGEDKDKAALYDIGDDLRHNSRVNFSLRHFEERQKIFKKEEFPIKIIKVRIVK